MYENNYLYKIILRIDIPPIGFLGEKEEIPKDFEKLFHDEFPQTEIKRNKNVSFDLNFTTNTLLQNDGPNSFSYIFYKTNEKWDVVKYLTLNSSFISLTYMGEFFNGFKEILNDYKLVFQCFEKFNIKTFEKIGLRYINVYDFEEPIQYINPKYGKFNVLNEDIGLVRSMTQNEYYFDFYHLIFKYGQYNSNYPSNIIKNNFILDYDCQFNSPESINDLKDYLCEMDKIIHQFFKNTITKKLKTKLGVIKDD